MRPGSGKDCRREQAIHGITAAKGEVPRLRALSEAGVDLAAAINEPPAIASAIVDGGAARALLGGLAAAAGAGGEYWRGCPAAARGEAPAAAPAALKGRKELY